MYELIALEKGLKPIEIRGTIQNDLLKEFIARGNYIFSPSKSLEISTLTSLYCIKNLPKWNHISVSGYHMAEAGAKPSQEIGFALSNGIEYVQSLMKCGIASDDACARVSFFFTSTTRLLEQIAKFRAAREVWAEICLNKFQIKNVNNAKLRFHTQTAGVELIAKDPILNVSRVTIQALAAILGGTQSLHTNGFDEAIELPSEKSAVMALNIQRILAEETDLTEFTDAFGNSDVVEELTSKMVREIRAVIKEIELLGGGLNAAERGFQKNLIEQNAFQELVEVENGSRSKIYSDNPVKPQAEASKSVAFDKIEEEIIKDLKIWKSGRDLNEIQMNLSLIEISLTEPENFMSTIKQCLVSGATIGEICDHMKKLWGTHDQEY
jgi:methylmalonyl-CoA mutase N-terminal domain/subunit